MRNLTVAAIAATLTLGAVCLTACGPSEPAVPSELEGPVDTNQEPRQEP